MMTDITNTDTQPVVIEADTGNSNANVVVSNAYLGEQIITEHSDGSITIEYKGTN
jgi:hypothetical protein